MSTKSPLLCLNTIKLKYVISIILSYIYSFHLYWLWDCGDIILELKTGPKRTLEGEFFKWICTTVFSPQAENLENISTYEYHQLVNLLKDLFLCCFSSEFSRILPPHSKFRSAAYDLGRHMICCIHNSFKLRSINLRLWRYYIRVKNWA
jgi:hypothetical protein